MDRGLQRQPKVIKSQHLLSSLLVISSHFESLQVFGEKPDVLLACYYLLLLTMEITLLNRIYGATTEQNNLREEDTLMHNSSGGGGGEVEMNVDQDVGW